MVTLYQTYVQQPCSARFSQWNRDWNETQIDNDHEHFKSDLKKNQPHYWCLWSLGLSILLSRPET